MICQASVELLEAELELGAGLVEALERQRSALLQRDLDQIDELTELLEKQLHLFVGLLERRSGELEGSVAATGPDRELLDRVRRTEVRVMELAEFNENLIADRLAWSSAMLVALGVADTGPGYGQTRGPASGAVTSFRRSA